MNTNLKSRSLRFFTLGLFVIVLAISAVSAATLSQWPLTTDGVASSSDSNINAGTFSASSSILDTSFGDSGAAGENWPSTDAVDSTKYFEVTLSPKAGYNMTVSKIIFDYGASASSAPQRKMELQVSKQSNFGSPSVIVTKEDVDTTFKESSNTPLNLNVVAGETLTLRFFGYNFNAATNKFSIKDLQIEGTAVIIPTPSLTLSLSPGNIESDSNTTTMTVENTGNVDLINVQLSASTAFNVEFNDTGFNLNAGSSKSVLVTRTTLLNSLKFGSNQITITAIANDGTSTSVSGSVVLTQLKNFYEGSNRGNIKISNIQFDTLGGFGDDEEFWYPLDEVEVEFEVENNGAWDIENIFLEACLYDLASEKCILDEDDMELSNDEFDLDSGDDQRVKLTFNINPDDLRKGNEDYTIFISAIGDIDDRDSSFDGEETGISTSKNIEIRTSEEFVIFDNVQFSGNAFCGQQVELTADVWNVGDNDMDDDEIFVLVSNKDLKISELIKFPKGLDAMEFERISLTLNIPANAQETQYSISLAAYEDENLRTSDIIQNREDDESKHTRFLPVTCSSSSQSDLLISANLDSEAKAGKEMTVKISLTNTATDVRSFVIDASGHESWAEISQLPSTITVVPGSTSEGTLKFNVNKGVSGAQQFNLNIYSGSDLIATQAVSVNIESSSFLGITGFSIGEGNGYLWGFGILNIILVIVIIIVAVRIARK